MSVDSMTSNSLPAAARTSITLTTWLAMPLHYLAWVSVLIILRLNVARFQALFDDFGVALPALTAAYLRMCDQLFASSLTLGMLYFVGAIVDAVAYHLLVRSEAHLARLWSFWIILLLPVGILILGVIAILRPLLNVYFELA